MLADVSEGCATLSMSAMDVLLAAKNAVLMCTNVQALNEWQD